MIDTPAPNDRSSIRRSGRLSPARIERLQRDSDALAFRLAGCTFDEIAVRLHMTNRSVAYKAVVRALERSAGANTEQLRAIELERTERIIARLWPAVDTDEPDLSTVAAIVKVMQHRARIGGLLAPQKHTIDVDLRARIDHFGQQRAIDALRSAPLSAELDALIETVAIVTEVHDGI